MEKEDKSDIQKHYWLYILKLEQGKYYVGITTQTPEARMQEHLKGVRAAYWTIKYKPLKVLDRKDLGIMALREAEKYENKIIRLYMKKYGHNNARGGDLTDPEDYMVRFHRVYLKDDWGVITLVVLLSLVILYFILKLYVWK